MLNEGTYLRIKHIILVIWVKRPKLVAYFSLKIGPL